MDRYQQMQNYLTSHLISQSSDQQKFQSHQHSLKHIQNQQQNDHKYLPSVKKFISQPNPLMNKIQFTPYHPKCYYPHMLGKLPKCLKDFSCIMVEKNNMNLLSEAVHGHQRLRKDVIDVLVNKNGKKSENNRSDLVTLEQYYGHKEPIYQRYSLKQMKLEENKVKLKYFATYVLDMAKIIKKQMKFHNHQQQNHSHFNTQANTQTVIKSVISSRPNSVSRSGNFIVRQQKTPHLQKIQKLGIQSHQSSRKSLHSNKIQFDSNFQSGNLFQVYQKQYNQYDLILQNDINTKGNTQWFFFSVKNVQKNSTVKFNIVNMSKSGSLFNLGMKPYAFSMMRYQKRNIGWIREGLKISYQQSQLHKKQSSNKSYYVLSFQYKFLYDGDIVYFSQSIPYTLTDLSSFLNTRLKDKTLHKIIKIKNVGLTLGSNQVDLLEITNTEFVNKNKKSVWIIARQHPGQTTSGFMMEGIIDSLLSNSQQSKTLLNNFVFKIIPMVNVDGVIHGNTRAQFIGSDPNRKWSNPHKLHNPIIHSIKHYIQKQRDNVEMFLDLHSHSRKLGTFFYGNTLSSNTAASRIYPLTVCKKDERFTFKYCRFSGGSNNAARYALYESLRIPLIYTVQCSFYGYQVGDHRIVQYLPNDYKQMGANLMKGFLDYELKKNGKTLKLLKPVHQIQQTDQRQIEQLMNDQQFQNQSVGSDEDPAEDQYSQKQFKKLIACKDLKKKKKTKKKQKEPVIKIKIKQPEPQSLKRPKANVSESYYREYFSGRVSSMKKNDVIESVGNKLGEEKKQTVSFGIQVSLIGGQIGFMSRRDSGTCANSTNGFGNVLTQRNNQQLVHSKLAGISGPLSKQTGLIPNNLCVIGQKVQQISIFGNTVGMQVTQNKQIFANRFENGNNLGANTNRKSFSVRQRINSFLQVKQNNFLQRGDCLTKNFFARK